MKTTARSQRTANLALFGAIVTVGLAALFRGLPALFVVPAPAPQPAVGCLSGVSRPVLLFAGRRIHYDCQIGVHLPVMV